MTDPLLANVFSHRNESSRSRALASLMLEHARPVILRVVLRSGLNLREEDVDDIVSTVNLRVMRRFGEVRDDDPVGSFADYIAAITYNAIYDFLRSRHPHRTRLKNRIRYALTHDTRFGVWERSGEMIAGLAAWTGTRPQAPPPVRELPATLPTDQQRTTKTIASVFARSGGGPILLDDLVGVIAELWGVTDAAIAPMPEAASEPGGALQVEAREYLGKLWSEIRDLPQPQRAALLLNLRDDDGSNALGFFLLARIARSKEIAESIGISAAQLGEVWDDLPLDDLQIAEILGKSRQQVINLRKAARERLSRRMNPAGRKP